MQGLRDAEWREVEAAKTTATAEASRWLDTRLGVRVNDRVGARGRPVPGSWARGSLLCFFFFENYPDDDPAAVLGIF